MAKAYWVNVAVGATDTKGFKAAIDAVRDTVEKYKGKYLVLGGKVTTKANPAPKRVVIVEFESDAVAQAWLNDPVAAAAREHVRSHVQTYSYVVEGV